MVGKPFSPPLERRPYRCWVEISRDQIASNFRAIQAAVGPETDVMPVVKADAYRHGAVEVSRTLQNEGARWLAVSNTEEGVVLRDAGIGCRILVMADFLPYTRETMLDRELTPVLHSLQDVAALDRLAEARGEQIAFHLKVDTGMGRLGVRPDAHAILEAVRGAHNLRLEGVMTHFASAGNYESNQTAEQIAVFRAVADKLVAGGISPAFIHLSSTIPIAYGRRDTWGQPDAGSARAMVRPGHGIYGYVSPARGGQIAGALDVRPALTWRASVLAVKEVSAGERIGYGGMFQAPRKMKIAVLAAGYADGIPHRLSNRGHIILKGQLAPILGAVSMDLTTVDASAAPGLEVGDAATLLGSEGEVCIDAQQIAKLAGTISYSVLCGIHARVKRIYL